MNYNRTNFIERNVNYQTVIIVFNNIIILLVIIVRIK